MSRTSVDRDDLDGPDLDGPDLEDGLDEEYDEVEPSPAVVRAIGWILAIAGAVGFLAAFVLSVERFILLADPDYVPTCSINSAVSCSTVMSSQAGALFGFPNPLLGIAGFAIVVTAGMAVIAGGRLAGWFWAGLQVGTVAAIVFVHWLMYQSLVVIQALCPYCMVVWVVTITTFWAVTQRNLYAWRASRGHPRPGNTPVISYSPIWLTAWLGAVAVVVIARIVASS